MSSSKSACLTEQTYTSYTMKYVIQISSYYWILRKCRDQYADPQNVNFSLTSNGIGSSPLQMGARGGWDLCRLDYSGGSNETSNLYLLNCKHALNQPEGIKATVQQTVHVCIILVRPKPVTDIWWKCWNVQHLRVWLVPLVKYLNVIDFVWCLWRSRLEREERVLHMTHTALFTLKDCRSRLRFVTDSFSIRARGFIHTSNHVRWDTCALACQGRKTCSCIMILLSSLMWKILSKVKHYALQGNVIYYSPKHIAFCHPLAGDIYKYKLS